MEIEINANVRIEIKKNKETGSKMDKKRTENRSSN